MNKYLPFPVPTRTQLQVPVYWSVGMYFSVIPEVKPKKAIKVNYGNSIQLIRGQDRPMRILHYRIYPNYQPSLLV